VTIFNMSWLLNTVALKSSAPTAVIFLPKDGVCTELDALLLIFLLWTRTTYYTQTARVVPSPSTGISVSGSSPRRYIRVSTACRFYHMKLLDLTQG
jgi:hypothetical protein